MTSAVFRKFVMTSTAVLLAAGALATDAAAQGMPNAGGGGGQAGAAAQGSPGGAGSDNRSRGGASTNNASRGGGGLNSAPNAGGRSAGTRDEGGRTGFSERSAVRSSGTIREGTSRNRRAGRDTDNFRVRTGPYETRGGGWARDRWQYARRPAGLALGFGYDPWYADYGYSSWGYAGYPYAYDYAASPCTCRGSYSAFGGYGGGPSVSVGFGTGWGW